MALAHGHSKGHKEVGNKGVPRLYVPWCAGDDNIDLFPEGFLWERGCNIVRGDRHCLISPKGREVQIKVWGSMPYISKNELQLILQDLPEHNVEGRTGCPAGPPTAARVALTVQPQVTRRQLQHLKGHVEKKDCNAL